MVNKFNTQFTSNTIDEQIDQRLAARQDEQDTLPIDHTIKALQQYYSPVQDHSQSLERVWSRFTSQRPSLETVEQDAYRQQPDITGGGPGKRNWPVHLEISGVDTPLRRSGLIAAVVFLVLIVSGMVALPQLLHRSNQATLLAKSVTPKPTFSVTIGEQFVYNVIPTDGGNAYLYTGTSPIKAGQSQAISPIQQFKPHSGKLVEVDSQKGGTKIWRYKGDLLSAPLLANGVLYVPSQSGLDALRSSNHTLLWHQNVPLLMPFDVNNGTLYAFGQDAGLEALRVRDGALLWHSKYKLAIGIENDIVYATENFDDINALRASDGALLWRTPLVDHNVFIRNEAVFLPTSSYGIRSLNSKTGMLLWSNEHISNVLATGNGIVYVYEGDGKNTIIALRVNNGQIIWQYRLVSLNGLLLSHDGVYVSTVQNNVSHVIALNPNNGKLLWQAKASGQAKLLKDGILYLDTGLSDSTTFLALRASDGSLLWHRNDIDHLSNSPLQAQDGVVYISLTDNKTIVALKVSDGTILARYHVDAL